MEWKLVFSKRYIPEDPYTHSRKQFLDPDRWAEAFLSSYDDRNTLANRLIKAAKRISAEQRLDMDIYDSQLTVRIVLYLPVSVYYPGSMELLALLLRVCDSMALDVSQDASFCSCTLFYDRDLILM